MPKEKEDIHVILDGRMAELLAKIAKETYQEYVSQRHNEAHMYCSVNVVIYKILKAMLLFWKNLSASLKMQGLEINPYNWFVTNKHFKMVDNAPLSGMWMILRSHTKTWP